MTDELRERARDLLDKPTSILDAMLAFRAGGVAEAYERAARGCEEVWDKRVDYHHRHIFSTAIRALAQEHAGVAQSETRKQEVARSTPAPSSIPIMLRRRTEDGRRGYMEGHRAGFQAGVREALATNSDSLLASDYAQLHRRNENLRQSADDRGSALEKAEAETAALRAEVERLRNGWDDSGELTRAHRRGAIEALENLRALFALEGYVNGLNPMDMIDRQLAELRAKETR